MRIDPPKNGHQNGNGDEEENPLNPNPDDLTKAGEYKADPELEIPGEGESIDPSQL